MRVALIIAAALPLAACGAHHVAVPSEVIHDQVKVPIPAPCPQDDAYNALAATKPTKLAAQPMPATAQERSAKAFGQLGKYEADGGWVDKAWAALTRCHSPP